MASGANIPGMSSIARRLGWLVVGFSLIGLACEKEDPGESTRAEEGNPPRSAGEGSEVVAGGGKVSGGNVTMDIQIGHGASQRQAATTDSNVEGNSVIKN